MRKIEKKLLSKDESEFDDLKDSLSVQIDKDAKIRNSLLEKCTLGREPRLWLYKLLQKR